MKEKEVKWSEFINANKQSYFDSINNKEEKVKAFGEWSVQKQYLHLKRFIKAQTPIFKKDIFVKTTLRNLTKIKSELVVSDELNLLDYNEYTKITEMVNEVHLVILEYNEKLKEIKKTTLQKQLEKLQDEMQTLN